MLSFNPSALFVASFFLRFDRRSYADERGKPSGRIRAPSFSGEKHCFYFLFFSMPVSLLLPQRQSSDSLLRITIFYYKKENENEKNELHRNISPIRST